MSDAVFTPTARLHMAVTYILLLLGTTGLWLGEPSPHVLPYPIFTALAAALAFAVTDRENGFELPPLVCNLLAVIVLGMVATEFSYDGVLSVVAMAHFLVYLQIVKFFRRKSDQDLWQLYGLNLLQLAIACVLNRQMSFGLLLLTYAALAVLTLMLFHLKRLRSGPVPTESWSLRMLLPSWLWASAAVLPVALAIFWITPRAGQPTGGVNYGDNERTSRQLTTGFSHSLELNEMQQVMENHDVVFNVWPTGPDGRPAKLPSNLLWRGQVFVSYRNNAWSAAQNTPFVRAWDRNADPLPGQVKLRIQQVVSTGEVLFAPKPLFWARAADQQADVEFVPHEGRLRYRRLGVPGGRGAREPVSYSLIVGLGGEFFHDGEHRSPSNQYLELASQLPPNLNRVLDLGKQLCADIPDADVQAKIQRLTNYFERDGGFSYTLNLDADDASLDRLEDFVFNRKRGHCEYFATALAVMLRAVKIPSRVVTGFKGADFNETGGYYQVRELLAHSWVEAYIAGEDRWQALDPSPSDLRDQVVAENRSPWQRLSEIADAASNAWATYFVGYSNMEQREALQALARDAWQFVLDALHNLFVGLPLNFFRWDFWASLRGVGALLTAAVLAAALRKLWRLSARLRKRVAGFRRGPSSWPLFRDWNRMVERLGFQRRISETPREFALRVADDLRANTRLGAFSAVHGAVAEAFYAARYGGVEANGALDALRQDLREFGRAAR